MLRSISALLASVSAAAMAAPEVERSVPASVTSISREELDKLPAGRRLEDLVRTCPSQTIPTVTPPPLIDGVSTRPGVGCVRPDDIRMIEIYKGHNEARALYGSQPIVWDPELARGAADYARQLTVLGRVHAPREGRKDIRENLLQSLNGQRSPGQMVRVWIDEKQFFKPGVFPDVSTTGNWAQVGHYTQIIWPATTRLGCAIHSDKQFDWTVCRYSPPGNRDGTMVAERATPPPLPPFKKEQALHDKPMAQPYAPPRVELAVKQIRCRTGMSPSPIGTYTYRVKVDPNGVTYSPARDGTIAEGKSGKPPAPPPESILDDIGDAAPAASPPESILDDVGDQPAKPGSPADNYYRVSDHLPVKADYDGSPATPREQPAPLPPSGKGKALHDTPMAQPLGPVRDSCMEPAGDGSGQCADQPVECRSEMRAAPSTPPAQPAALPDRPTSQDVAGLFTHHQRSRERFYDALKACDWDAAAREMVEMDYVTEEYRKHRAAVKAAGKHAQEDLHQVDAWLDRFERIQKTSFTDRLEAQQKTGCAP